MSVQLRGLRISVALLAFFQIIIFSKLKKKASLQFFILKDSYGIKKIKKALKVKVKKA